MKVGNCCRCGLQAKRQLWKIVIILALLNVAALFSHYSYTKTRQSRIPAVRVLDHGKLVKSRKETAEIKRKTILLWNMPEDVSYPKILDTNQCNDCVITKDRNLHNTSDAVVFRYHGTRSPKDVPARPHRNPDQIYVWLCRESPKNVLHIHKYKLKNFNHIFNWSMTHRLDSDVFYPYVEMLHRIQHDKKLKGESSSTGATGFLDLHYRNVSALMKRKKFLAAWVVGNCDGTAGARDRMMAFRKLKAAGLKVDGFGKCFEGSQFPPYRSEEAHERLMEYKFYLAFENTKGCRDYVTYKFWKNAIYSGAVPIVWGPDKEDLARLAPKQSFIHVDDFDSEEKLVKYVNYLDSNDTAYREYFWWRERGLRSRNLHSIKGDDWIFSVHEAFGFCKLCRKLHTGKFGTGESSPRKSIPSLEQWWYGTESESCLAKS